MSRRLEVLLHDRVVGYLIELPAGGAEFRFVETYPEWVPRPVLGQKFEDDLERVHRSRKRSSLPDFFANLVPEGRLREVIEDQAPIDPGDDLALLGFVGRDLPGAVIVRSLGVEVAAGLVAGPDTVQARLAPLYDQVATVARCCEQRGSSIERLLGAAAQRGRRKDESMANLRRKW